MYLRGMLAGLLRMKEGKAVHTSMMPVTDVSPSTVLRSADQD